MVFTHMPSACVACISLSVCVCLVKVFSGVVTERSATSSSDKEAAAAQVGGLLHRACGAAPGCVWRGGGPGCVEGRGPGCVEGRGALCVCGGEGALCVCAEGRGPLAVCAEGRGPWLLGGGGREDGLLFCDL